MKKELTSKQNSIYMYIVNYSKVHGKTPMLTELADSFCITKRAMLCNIELVEKKGYLNRIKNKKRNIIIL